MLLITGGTGQVGKDLIQLLRSSDMKHAFTSRNGGKSSDNSKHIKIDLSTPSLDWSSLAKEVTGIVHLAAAVPHSREFPGNLESAAKTERNGLKVFDFHPIQIYLNTDSLALYEGTRPNHNDLSTLINYRSTNRGVRKKLIDILEMTRG